MKKTWWRITDHHRSRQRRERVLVEGESDDHVQEVADPAAFDPERQWAAEWENNLLSLALEGVRQKLDTKKYQAFQLYVLEGMTVGDVARIMGVSVGSVYLTKYRVTLRLRRELQRVRKTAEKPAAARKRTERGTV